MAYFRKHLVLWIAIFIPALLAALFFYLNPIGLGSKKIKTASCETCGILLANIFNLVESAAEQPKPQYIPDFTTFKGLLLQNEGDFLEINLAEMKVKVFRQGKIIKEAGILRKGDALEWGGTAAGLYQVRSGFKVAFSSVAEVYMPHSLSFYGKYYIHGEPYFPGGQKSISDVSGGCVQLLDKDAQEVYEAVDLKMPVLVLDKINDDFVYNRAPKEEPPAVSAKSYLVADLDSGFIFAEKNSHQTRQIASLAKLMTAVVVAENIDLRRTIQVKDYMLTGFGQTDGLESGKTFRVVELFYPLLRESSNDAAEVLSWFLGRQRTIDLMNEKAKAILMQGTTFTCPSGYDEGNISTAQALFHLAHYILNNRPPIFRITRGETVQSFGPIRFDLAGLWNKNIFSEDETFVGGKTGYIEASGYNGLFVFKFKTKTNQERNVAIILLGSDHSDNTKAETQKLYLWLQRNFFN